MAEFTWGDKFAVRVAVSRLVGGNRRDMLRNRRTGHWFPKPNLDAQNYHKELGRAVELHLAKEWREGMPRFPLEGKELYLRLDLYFGFGEDERGGWGRMKLSDEDNLRKTTKDALQGVLYTNDRMVTEGFTAIGTLPAGTRNDFVWIVLSRAGYREAAQMETIVAGLPVFHPWRPQDQGEAHPIITPGKRIVSLEEFAREQAGQKKH